MATLAEVAQASSVALAGHLAGQCGMQVGSALPRVYRLLRHERIEEQRLTAPRLRLRARPQARVRLALDWTEWPHGLRILVAAVVVGCRAIPVPAAACSKTQIPRAQNLRETTYLPLFVHTLRTVEHPTVLVCDRGFRRVSW
jgi:hypothetical protein